MEGNNSVGDSVLSEIRSVKEGHEYIDINMYVFIIIYSNRLWLHIWWCDYYLCPYAMPLRKLTWLINSDSLNCHQKHAKTNRMKPIGEKYLPFWSKYDSRRTTLAPFYNNSNCSNLKKLEFSNIRPHSVAAMERTLPITTNNLIIDMMICTFIYGTVASVTNALESGAVARWKCVCSIHGAILQSPDINTPHPPPVMQSSKVAGL